jgi:putative pyridoxal-dependent aspartate 1-decarboxylase
LIEAMENIRQVLSVLREKQVKVSVRDAKLVVNAPKGAMTAEVRDIITANKEALLNYFQNTQVQQVVSIPPVAAQDSYAVSPSQFRLWVLSQFDEASVAYNLPSTINLSGVYNIDTFKKALHATIERHEILRTVFKDDENGNVKQSILTAEELEFELQFKDLRDEEDPTACANGFVNDDSWKPFDLENGPLLRASLFQTADEDYIFYFNMHHIISDGWSMDVLTRDMMEIYQSFQSGITANLPALNIQYKDYSAWCLSEPEQQRMTAHRAFWLKVLAGELPPLSLPTTSKRPKIKTYNGRRLGAYLSPEVSGELKRFCLDQGGSLFMGLLTSWNILSYRYTNQRTSVVGSPVAGREHADLEHQIGFYVNTLALKTEVDPRSNFTDLFAAVKACTLSAFTHQSYPFDKLVEDLKVARDTSRSPIFDVMLTLQNVNSGDQLPEPSASEMEQINDYGDDVAKFDLEFTFREVGECIRFDVNYNTDVYESALINNLIGHFKALIEVLLANPLKAVGEVNILKEAEKTRLLQEFNDNKVEHSNASVLELFEEQVIANADANAILFEDKKLTYAELDKLSNQLANYLKQTHQLSAESLVGIQLERSEWLVVCVLGVLKAGAAYVPIDPAYPADRIEYIRTDSGCKLCIDEAELQQFISSLNEISTSSPATSISPDQLAYVIYTSGSTGKPKGVMVEHGNMSELIHWSKTEFDASSFDRSFFVTSVCFDLSIFEVFYPLTSGKEVHILQDGLSVASHLESEIRFLLNTVPSVVGALLAQGVDLSPIKVLNMAGEPIPLLYLEQLHGVVEQVRNLYGPSEDTTYSTFTRIEDPSILTIGRPISNTQAYILNDFDQVQPLEVIGEICLSGTGLTRGYLNRPELTIEKYVLHPFQEGERLYRTGDLGRWLPDGTIAFVGRKDDQVKIRGYRIELGEIEYTLESLDAIENAVVIAHESENSGKELVAYITAAEEQNATDLRNALSVSLPDYMLPAQIIQVDEIPTNANGKVDKKALLMAPGVELSTGVQYVEPSSIEEQTLAQIWEKVLGRDKVGALDNFYNLGGDSIKSIQVVSRLKQFGYALKVEHILRTPVLSELAQFVTQNDRLVDQSAVEGAVELTPVQRHFFEDESFEVRDHYNQSVLLKSDSTLDHEVLKQSIEKLIEHHDALRMVYKLTESTPEQYNSPISFDQYELHKFDLTDAEDELAAMAAKGAELQPGVDLEHGPMVRAAHFQMSDGDRLALFIHHLVVDGVSWRVLLEDLSTLYKQISHNEKVELPLKTDAFQTWSKLQKEYAFGNVVASEKPYWNSVCSQLVPQLPTDFKVDKKYYELDDHLTFTLSEETTNILQTKVHAVYNTEINDVLLSMLGLAIREVLGVEKTVFKMEGHGREEIIDNVDISRTVGWFTTMFPFVLDIANSDSGADALIQVKENLRRIPNKGIGYGILKYLSEAIDKELQPTFIFNYLGDFGSKLGNEEEALFQYSSELIGDTSSKKNGSDLLLDVSGILMSGKLSMSIAYSSELYQTETVQKLVDAYEKHLQALIDDLGTVEQSYLTPSDLTYKALSAKDLFTLNADGNIEDVYELSPLQTGIYFHWMHESVAELYFEQLSYQLKYPSLKVDSVQKAFDLLLDRHAILRTSFSNELGPMPLQIVRKNVPGAFEYEQVSNALQGADRESFVESQRRDDRLRGFDLTQHSQMRLKVLDFGNGEYEFIWSHHHILMDGWCMSILIGEFSQFLGAVEHNVTADLPKPAFYSTYIEWLSKLDTSASISYWKDYLQGYSNVTQIPFTQLSDGNGVYEEATRLFSIETATFDKINEVCKQAEVTQNSFVQGVWGYLMAKYNGVTDAVFGAVVSGRPPELHGVEHMVGLFINTIPVRVQFESTDTPLMVLKNVQEHTINSANHHYLNLSEVQAQSEVGRDLIKHILVFENYPVQDAIQDDAGAAAQQDLSIEKVELFEQTHYDFDIVVKPSASTIEIEFRFNRNKYEEAAIDRMVAHLKLVIEQFCFNVDKPLTQIDYLSEEEKSHLLVELNDTEVAYPQETTILDLIDAQVKKHPEKTAVVFEDRALTYQELDVLSDQFANFIQEQFGVAKGDFVGIQLLRSEWMSVSILGILKSGAAYVPIDPSHPQDRIDYIKTDCNCIACIDGEIIEQFQATIANYESGNLDKKVNPDQLAYVIYTSGTTGLPKGVLNAHSGLFNRLMWMQDALKIDETDVVLQKTPVTFDVSVWELLIPFMSGATLVYAAPEGHKDPFYLSTIIQEQGVSIVHFVPSMLDAFVAQDVEKACAHLKHVVCSGEALTASVLELAKRKLPSARIHNYYGPTEAAIDVTSIDLTDVLIENSMVSIGQPVANTQIYIVDAESKLVPKGVAGELLIGGVQVARGYQNKTELTSERFVPSPFIEGQRLYKTGDVAKWLTNNTIAYLGRNDDQVKIRGHRIELGEIEHALQKIDGIEGAVVIAHANHEGEKELAAYFISSAEQEGQSIRTHLRNDLPEHMIPAHFVQLEEIPLSQNGKVNRKALPALEGAELASGVEYVAPRNTTEEEITVIWQAILNVEKIGIHDDFFALGGHSLRATRLVGEYHKKFDARVELRDLFAATSIAEHAALLTGATEDQFALIPVLEDAPHYPVSEAQRRLWVLSQFAEASVSYNMPGQFVFEGDYDVALLSKAVECVVERHEILRTVFRDDEDGVLQQWVLKKDELGFAVQFEDFSANPDANEQAATYVANDRYRAFDLTNGPLIRVTILKLAENSFVLYCNMHHIVSDGWSLDVLTRDIVAYYEALVSKTEVNLPELRIQYRDFAAWQRSQLQGEQLSAHHEFWTNKLAGDIPVLDLPTDQQRPKLMTYAGRTLSTLISAESTEKLRALCQQNKGSLFMGLLTVWNVLCARYSGQKDIIVGSPIAGRNHSDLTDQIGFYINTLVLRTELNFDESFEELLKRVIAETISAYEHQNYPFDRLVEDLDLKRDTSRNALFDVMLTLQNMGETATSSSSDIAEGTITDRGVGVTKFDFDITFQEVGKCIAFDLSFNTDIYSQSTVERLMTHFMQLLEAAVCMPNEKVGTLPLLSETEQVEILETFNDTGTPYSSELNIIELFEQQVQATPDAIAIVSAGSRWTFRELNNLANRYADYLEKELGVHSDDKLLVSLAHDENLMATLLATKKLGAVYVPVDPQTPTDRTAFIEKDSSCVTRIDVNQLSLMKAHDGSFTEDQSNPTASDLEFIIYTSGSTGRPKGIKITGKSVLNRVNWMWHNYPFQASDVCCAKTSISFVDHIWEFFGPLLKGVPLVFFKKEELLEVPAFIDLLAHHKVSRIVLVPTLLREMLSHQEQCREKLQRLTLWISSGEALKQNEVDKLYRTLRSPHVHLLNIYGSTEVTADATYYDTYQEHNPYKEFGLFETSIEQDITGLIDAFDSEQKIASNSFEQIIEQFDFTEVAIEGKGKEEYVSFLKEQLLPNVVNVGAAKYIGHMTGPIPAVFRELGALVTVLNQNQVKIETSLISTLVERQVVGAFHHLAFGESEDFYKKHVQDTEGALGVVTNGGTISNIKAMSYALNSKLKPRGDFRGIANEGLVKGLAEYGYQSVALIGSSWCHYSFGKALKILGLGREAFVEADFEGKSPEQIQSELTHLVSDLRSKHILVLGVAGIAGTTESGNVEPLHAIGSAAKALDLHFHVDAAFGGSFLMHDELRKKLAGIELADSVSMCAHKQLYLPIGLSICLFKDPSFALDSEHNAKYQARKGSYDLGRYTIEGSRNFMSLLLHAALNIFGKQGFGEIVEHNYNTSRVFVKFLKEHDAFELLFEPDLNIILYRYLPQQYRGLEKLTEAQIEDINELNISIQKTQFERGNSFVSYTTIKQKNAPIGSVMLRTVFMNPNTTASDLKLILQEQLEIAAELQGRSSEDFLDTSRSNISIGKPIENVKVYILDQLLNVLPKGVVGEVCIAGDCVADGYLNTDKSGKPRFIESPFCEGERLFRTGDLGKWQEDGNIELVGRLDDQIKIRGNRVELGEIENALLAHEAITEIAVVAKAFDGDDLELAVYFVAQGEFDVQEIREFLSLRLPQYMMPDYFIQLDEMPLMSSGKVNKGALPDAKQNSLDSAAQYVAPTTAIQTQCVEIWTAILKRENIGIKDDFFALGGHSLKATRLVSEYHKAFEVKLGLKDIFTRTTISDHAELIQASVKVAFERIEKIALADDYTISDAQRRLWVLSQFEGASVTYNMPFHLILEGQYNLTKLGTAINQTIERHETLRTVFFESDLGEVRQRVLDADELNFKITHEDLRQEPEKEARVKNYIVQDSVKPFDLEQGPLIRVALLQVEDDKVVLYYNMHHIISDGTSLNVLSKDVITFYEALQSEQPSIVEPLNVQYKDYANWQLQQLESDNTVVHKQYWKSQFEEELTVLDLPSTRKRPQLKTYTGRSLGTYISEQSTNDLRTYCEANGGSLFMGLLSLWNALMHRYSNAESIVIGTPVAGRDHVDLENQIGFYVNTLALRTSVDATQSFSNLFEGVKATTLSAYEHQMYPFDRLVNDLNLARDTSRSALFDIMLVLQNTGDKLESIGSINEAEEFIIDHGQSIAQFDIDVTFTEVGDHLTMAVAYNTDVYDQSMVEGLMIHFKQLLRTVLASPETSIGKVDFLNGAERKILLEDFNSGSIPSPVDSNVVDTFAKQVVLMPDVAALTFAGVNTTYAELDQRSNQLANYLCDKGVEKGEMVTLELPRSDWQLVAILAVLKAGAAYVPIDTEYPQDRIDFIKQDCTSAVTIDTDLLEAFKAVQTDYSTAALEIELAAESTAYVIYTSGSTGQPKGVMISHDNLLQKLHEEQALFALDNPVTYCLTNYVFDVSLLELIYPLLFGGRVVMPSAESIADAAITTAELLKEEVTILQGTPTYFNQFLSSAPSGDLTLLNKSLQVLCIGGEALTQDLVQKVNTVLGDVCLNNHYGPTEITIDAIVSTNVKELSYNSIGKPLGNTTAYIITSKGALSPIGVTGEICIGGPSVAQGYLNRAELTSEYFVPNPFASKELMYRTGDLGCWHDDGTIEFLGRIDDQVKVRGYRIELGEVEHALSTVEAITGVTVTTHKNAVGENEFVAYVTSEIDVDVSGVRTSLKAILPAYMVPSHFVQIPSIPVTTNGKVNKQLLPDPSGNSVSSSTEYVAPETELQKQIVAIWEAILETENIGMKDDFFELGGHSLKATRLRSEYHRTFNVKLELKDLFTHTEVEQHVDLIDVKGWLGQVESSTTEVKEEEMETINF